MPPHQLKSISVRAKIILFILFLLIGVGVQAENSEATTLTMSSCNQSAFNTAYNTASSGDTIIFPLGPCTINWSGTTNIAKTNLIIQGQGVGITVLNMGQFSVTGSSGNGLRITGVDFRGSGGSDDVVFTAIPNSNQRFENIRLDHNRFYNFAIGSTWGYAESTSMAVPQNCVMDNNLYENMTYEGNYVWGPCADTSSFPFTLGTADGVYFEDNEIRDPTGVMSHFITSRCASRYVIRYNNFSSLLAWDAIDIHDSYEGSGRSNAKRGSWTAEIYNNKFTYSGNDKRIINFRGGQAVVWGNHYNNSQPTGGINLQSYNIQNDICIHGQVIADDGRYCDAINQTYVWGNKYNCGSDMTNCASGTAVASVNNDGNIVLNVDYWMSAMPGYVPLAYPHPLRNESQSDPTPPASPSWLSVR